MASLSATLGAEAAPHVIEHNGRKYPFGHVTGRVKSAVERWLEDRALDAMERAAARFVRIGALTPDAVREMIQGFVNDCLAGKYAFGGKESAAALATTQGGVKIASELLGCTEDEAFELILAKPAEVSAKLKLLVGESFPAPKAEAPAEPQPQPGSAA